MSSCVARSPLETAVGIGESVHAPSFDLRPFCIFRRTNAADIGYVDVELIICWHAGTSAIKRSNYFAIKPPAGPQKPQRDAQLFWVPELQHTTTNNSNETNAALNNLLS